VIVLFVVGDKYGRCYVGDRRKGWVVMTCLWYCMQSLDLVVAGCRPLDGLVCFEGKIRAILFGLLPLYLEYGSHHRIAVPRILPLSL
jgi:hypothetical protein